MIGIGTGFEYLLGERSYSLSNYTKGALLYTFQCVAWCADLRLLYTELPCEADICRIRNLALPMGELSAKPTEREDNDHTQRQQPIRKCPAASQGDDTP